MVPLLGATCFCSESCQLFIPGSIPHGHKVVAAPRVTVTAAAQTRKGRLHLPAEEIRGKLPPGVNSLSGRKIFHRIFPQVHP